MKSIIKYFFIILLLAGDPADARDYREFSPDKVEELRESGEYDYGPRHAPRESLWDRILRAAGNWIRKLFGTGPSPYQLEVFIYIVAFLALLWAILKLFGIEYHHAFRKPPPRQRLSYDVNEEDIHKINFPEEIARALAEKQWRLVVRLQYLFALKRLADKRLVKVASGKTNHDYLYELQQEAISRPFGRLSVLFEYTWYGQFEVTEKVLDEARDEFQNLEKAL
ncbi:MAG TPA: hypothetical protein DCG19_01360 [Cryomorphaceae bacterium]|nr:hypothetical protein [Owenweeksia sp.]MBF99939.1 hypothetical protein [Owenweeksia sp.]HAD96017.1 hypothetical protein [Cryomorphaceae bacterium]HBF21665.1 hypothetical protein [Cryomorphaceae bacterium]|tara:strand:- start:7028 stop:7699 length:672 start_codon:yes stop_codon:yes gene_type:complete